MISLRRSDTVNTICVRRFILSFIRVMFAVYLLMHIAFPGLPLSCLFYLPITVTGINATYEPTVQR